MQPKFLKYAFACLLALSLVVGSTIEASADRIPKYLNVITFTNPSIVDLGKPFFLSGTLKTWYGASVPDLDIKFLIDGEAVGQARTDSNGYFQRRIANKFSSGNHAILAFTDLSLHYLGTSAATNLEILPTRLRIQTVPAIPGLTFEVDGQKVKAGSDGEADAWIGSAGTYRLTVLTDQYKNPDQRIEFSRWMEETFQPYTLVQVPTDNVVQVGLNVYQKVSQHFVDLDGTSVAPQRVTELTIRSAQGDLFTFTDDQLHWVPASRVARYNSGLVATPLLYSVIDAMVDGSNAVNQSQQRFLVHPNDSWKVSLILYSLTVRAKDGLVGSSVGKSINLIYPDGHVINYPFDKNGSVAIDGLARGNYTVQVIDAKGLKQVIPVALSRSQTVEIKVPTKLDLVIAASLGLAAVLGLILYGRRRRLGGWMKRNRPALLKAKTTGVKLENLQAVDVKAELTDRNFIKWS